MGNNFIVIASLTIIGGIIGLFLYIRRKNRRNISHLVNDNDYNQPISNDDVIP